MMMCKNIAESEKLYDELQRTAGQYSAEIEAW